MLNPFEDIHWHPTVPEIRKNGIVLIIGLELIAGIVFLASGRFGFSCILPAVLGPVLFLLSLISRTGKYIYLATYCLAASIGIVVSNVFLALFFFLVLTPIAWVLRLRKINPITGRKAPDAASNWKEYRTSEDPTRYFKQY